MNNKNETIYKCKKCGAVIINEYIGQSKEDIPMYKMYCKNNCDCKKLVNKN